jgi:hypothetical protein
MNQGIIDSFGGSYGSGLATLVINGQPVMCENTGTVRALDACFGDVITDAHSVDEKPFVGQRIVFEVDNVGILEWFAPWDKWRAQNPKSKPRHFGFWKATPRHVIKAALFA